MSVVEPADTPAPERMPRWVPRAIGLFFLGVIGLWALNHLFADLSGFLVTILISFDGAINAADCEIVTLREGRPRDVLKVRGIRKAFAPSTLEIDSDLVHRIRTGLHSKAGWTELHFVADLSRPVHPHWCG